ncbi:MAG: hypothetical protein L6Q81_13930 [Bacteroidia bacterium]|nr:hypothetical protein [Bacteroidia bacterium]
MKSEHIIYILFLCGILWMIIRLSIGRVGGKFEKVPLTEIGEASTGQVVKVKGSAVFVGETIKAPFTGRKCVYYVAQVHHWRGRWGRSSFRLIPKSIWVQESSVEIMGSVVIYAAGHYALLDTVKVRSDIHKDESYVVGTMHSKSPAMIRFIKENHINPNDFLGIEKSLRWSEGIIENGEECVMMGVGTWKTPEECGLKIDAEKILVITDIPGDYAYISDRV